MKLQDQVATLEQSKRLKELGIDAESTFTHGLHVRSGDFHWEVGIFGMGDHGNCIESYPAYTVAELETMLLCYRDYVAEVYKSHMPDCWFWQIIEFNTLKEIKHCKEGYETSAIARAELLIHLLSNSGITASQVNASINE